MTRAGIRPKDDDKDRWVVLIDKEAPSADGVPKKEVRRYLRNEVFNVSKALQKAVKLEWRKRHGESNIIIVEGGSIQKGKTLKYQFELYQLHLTDEIINEFEELCRQKLDEI